MLKCSDPEIVLTHENIFILTFLSCLWPSGTLLSQFNKDRRSLKFASNPKTYLYDL